MVGRSTEIHRQFGGRGTQVAAFGGLRMLPRTLTLKLWNSCSW